MSTLIQIEQLRKVFGKQIALDRIDAQLPKGKIIGLVGPDAAGKTTLIRLLAALLLPSEGSIRVAGFDTIKESTSIHESIGYMPQRFGLYEDLTVMQNLTLYADLNAIFGKEREAVFQKLLAFTNLKPFTDRLAKNLSGGMKQKLGLACTLIRTPLLLLLDEPSVGVDPISRRELWKMVQELTQEGISILWSTTYLDEAQKCDRVLLLNEGKLLFEGPPAELTAKMEGKTFRTPIQNGNKRTSLFQIINRSDVLDATMEGEAIRIVTQEKGGDPSWEPVAPRFEDAFLAILGGCPKGVSQLAERTPTVEGDHEFVVVAESLTKKFGSFTAVDQISFQVRRGEVFGLLGPNGAGKSTTFKMLCGLLKITAGNATINGKNLMSATSMAREHIGYMAQKFSLYGDLSVLQNLQFFSGVYHLHGKNPLSAIEEMVEIFNFHPFVDTKAADLPLGYKQRLALACATMHHPPVLFLDEPTSGVDPITRREFWNHINGLVEKGTTIIVTTHFMDEAEYCDRIALIYEGKIVQLGRPHELKQKAEAKTLEEAFIRLIERVHAV